MRSSGVDRSTNACLPSRSSRLIHVACALCGGDDPAPVAVGEDFEFRSSDDTFLMVRCRSCDLLYLNPRPAGREAEQRYERGDPDFGYGYRRATIAARVRRRLEGLRLSRSCGALSARARVLDLDCGDGFRLAAMRAFAPSDVRFEGVERDPDAVVAARLRGLTVHHGTLTDAGLESCAYDLVLGHRALEGSGDPGALLGRIRDVLRPGGIFVVEAGNAASPGCRVFRNRYWGGYRFPQAWNVFTAATVSRLATESGLRVKSVATRVSPSGWIDSIRNALLDMRAPQWLVGRFTHNAPALLAIFTIVDSLGQAAGGGSVLCAILQRPPL